MVSFIDKLFGKKEKEIQPKELINYYYQTIIETSLQGLNFPVSDGQIDKKRVQPTNIFFINHNEKNEKTYSDNFQIIQSHIKSIDEHKRDKYKIIFFPFVYKFLKYSSQKRKDFYITTPIYFLFDIDENVVESLKKISLDSNNAEEVFSQASLVYNKLFASRSISAIELDEISRLNKELEDEDVAKKYPKKDLQFFKSIFLTYLKNCKANVTVDENSSYDELIKAFYDTILKNGGNDKIDAFENKSAIILIESEKAVESDKMFKGLLDAYKTSILPSVEKHDMDDKLQRIFFRHSKKVYLSKSKHNKVTEKNTLDLSIQTIVKLQKKHLGSFSDKFALTVSQRLALCSTLCAVDVIPVNGPPGTGKTALLRSIFANYIVDKAFNAYNSYHNNRMDPFVLIDTGKPILGTSSVIQAINNLISGINDGFADASKIGAFFQRWLDFSEAKYNNIDLNEKFVFVPQIRNSEEKFEKGVLFTGVDTICHYLDGLNGKKLEENYLKKYNEIYGEKVISVEGCIEPIFGKMVALKNSIENAVGACRKLEEKQIFEILENLDKKERFSLFFMSLHLLEVFFIINIKTLNKQQSNPSSSKCYCPLCGNEIVLEKKIKCGKCHYELVVDQSLKVLKEEITNEDIQLLVKDRLIVDDVIYGTRYNKSKKRYYTSSIDHHSLAKLNIITPLFPMLTITMHSLYGAFKQEKDKKMILEKDFFDLILTDESGMILPSVALPAMFVSRKMVVVGDEKQIEPISPFDRIIDKSIVKKLKFKNEYEKFFERYSILNKNFISLVNDSSYFNSYEMKEYEKNNLWLKEHFRCKDEIIEYCNEIVYKGILLPKVRAVAKKSLYLDDLKEKYPSLKLFNVNSTVKNNQSEVEATAINEFLLQNVEELTEAYNRIADDKDKLSPEEFHKHIGIVTPFNNQKNLIKQKLSKKYSLNEILIGTVHAFQGSEKEIIIFSPVIDQKCNYQHFTNKDNGNMMNVAVSRAKSAFWVFGSAEGMKHAGEYTEVLEKYIKCKENYITSEVLFNEIAHCEVYPKVFKKQGKLVYKNFRGIDFTKEEAEQLLDGKSIVVCRKSQKSNEYYLKISLIDDKGKFSQELVGAMDNIKNMPDQIENAIKEDM